MRARSRSPRFSTRGSRVDQFFEMMAYDLELTCDRALRRPEVLFALNNLLLQQAEQGRTTVLIVDEAHNLDREVLEEVRLLGNMENPARQIAPDDSRRPNRTGS